MSGSAVAATGATECRDVPTDSTMSPPDEAAARAGICDTLAGLASAWGEHDADAYGAHFTENATYTTFAGTYYDGREDIVRSHAALFDGPLSGTRLADSYLSLRLLTEDVAVLTTRGDTYDGDTPGELSKVQTYTMIRDGDDWQVAAFQNTQRKKLMEQVQFRWMDETVPAAER
ncbi:SgcJ/EcaC family oxidoreductase [Rhodococcus rhodnii]|nr:SgcJ/EcaC family oxidoreductase [Rhodococcus rhodnii]